MSTIPKFIPIEAQSVHTSCGIDGHCITCSDEAVTVKVVSVDDTTGMALVAIENVTEEVDVTLIETVKIGDSILVHGGVAIAHLGEA